uniref:RNase H type-1 domain-containing protein n=1 Tax=Salvator merianae TaxID=96440 RepID=A0A8D0E368_SALMN
MKSGSIQTYGFRKEIGKAFQYRPYESSLKRKERWYVRNNILYQQKEREVLNSCVNPASFLWKREGEELEPEHNCLDITEYQTKVRPDLADKPLYRGERIFIDGSSRMVQGKRHSGYAVINGDTREVIEAGRLPNTWSAQTCELYALNQALKSLNGKEGTIYTDSQYAFGVVPTFGKIWRERGLINSRGKELVHEELVVQILENLLLPKERAVIHVPGHQKLMTPEAKGNKLADEMAKKVALQDKYVQVCVGI